MADHTPGDALRRAREQRGLTLEQIAAATGIPIDHLEALERDDVSSVPGGMYRRAEIRRYAEAVGLNRPAEPAAPEPAVEPRAVIEMPLPLPPTLPSPMAPPRQARRTSLGRPLILGACAALLVLGLWTATRVPPATPPPAVVLQTRTAPVEAVTRVANVESAKPLAAQPAQVPSAADTAAADHPTFDPQLAIVTAPAGARVTVDGVGWGVTPVTIRYLPPGHKRLRITRDGFAAAERTVELGTDRPRTTVRITLRPLKASRR